MDSVESGGAGLRVVAEVCRGTQECWHDPSKLRARSQRYGIKTEEGENPRADQEIGDPGKPKMAGATAERRLEAPDPSYVRTS